jgi:glycosylphosphatidylinositol deacylase
MSYLNKSIRFLFTCLILALLGIGLVDYLTNFDENECSMTYMFQPPNLIEIPLDSHIDKQFPFYKLYLYCEGYDCQKLTDSAASNKVKLNKPGNIPILFITGNADSHKQVRSLASVALDKSRQNNNRQTINFQYFTISFNEELSALYGQVLQKQSDYTKHCIKHILTLYLGIKQEVKRPKSVLVIGNSMGGLVARSLFVHSPQVDFDTQLVHTIITQATPHKKSVINFDKEIDEFYSKVNSIWFGRNQTTSSNSNLNRVLLISLYGGFRDILVRSDLANLNDMQSPAKLLSIQTSSLSHVWRSIDHRCMSWCRELVLATNRALFDLVDRENTMQLKSDLGQRLYVFKSYFEHGFYFTPENDQQK